MAAWSKIPFAVHSLLAQITLDSLWDLLVTFLVIGRVLLMLPLTTVRFLHVMVQCLRVTELPCALLARQLCNCCSCCTLSAVLLEVFLRKNCWSIHQVVAGGGAHLEVGGESARLHPLLAASNVAVNLLRNKQDDGDGHSGGNDCHKNALENLPLFEGHQGLGELEEQILGVGGALRCRRSGTSIPATFAL